MTSLLFIAFYLRKQTVPARYPSNIFLSGIDNCLHLLIKTRRNFAVGLTKIFICKWTAIEANQLFSCFIQLEFIKYLTF